MNAGAAEANPAASPGVAGFSCAAAAEGVPASTIRAMAQVRDDRTVFISLLLLRSEDHGGREHPTPRREADCREAARCYVAARGPSSRGARIPIARIRL